MFKPIEMKKIEMNKLDNFSIVEPICFLEYVEENILPAKKAAMDNGIPYNVRIEISIPAIPRESVNIESSP